MDEEINPLKDDLWGVAIMGIGAHFYPKGVPKSLCGRDWLGDFWTLAKEQPKDKICEKCLELKAKRPRVLEI
jgi:hypothetical protein